MNAEAQEAALRSYETQNKIQRRSDSKDKKSRRKEKHRSHKKSVDKSNKKTTKPEKRTVETRPSAQIAPKSYLGSALKKVGEKQRYRHEPSSWS